MRLLQGVFRLLDWIAHRVEERRAPLAVFLLAAAVWWLQALVWPLAAGRDFGTYAGAYLQLFDSHAIDLGYVLGRTPIAPILIGVLLDPLGGALAEPVVSLLYAATVTAWFLTARVFGGRAALLTTTALLLYPGYGILMHELSSDPVFAMGFAGWSLLLVRVLLRPSTARFALVGAGVGLLVLIRPGNQALLVLALLPLVLALPWRARISASVAFAAAAIALLGVWTVHNGVRYGDYTVARGGNSVPFNRAFLTDRIVSPDNGPASRRLARAVELELLPEEPYRSYGVGLEDFFSDPSPRMLTDLGVLADRLSGWSSDGRILRDAGVEAVRTHPGPYARGVAHSVWGSLHQSVFRPLPTGEQENATSAASQPTDETDDRGLPEPTEGERIPAARQGGPTSPDGSIYTVWTSPTEHHLVFVHPGDARRLATLHARMAELESHLPDRSENATVVLRLNQLSKAFPPPVVWLLLGIAGIAVRRPRNLLALTAPAIAAVIVIVLSALAVATVPHYSVPVVPAFVLLAAGGLFGPRRALPGPDSGTRR